MRWVAVLVIACGCDRVLGLSSAAPADALPPDAAPMCPAIGGPAPAFNGALLSLGAKTCVQYSVSAASDTAMAVCTATVTMSIEQGAIGDTLTASTIDLAGIPVMQARIAPEGDLAIVVGYSGSSVIRAFARGAGADWSLAATIDTTIFTSQITTPSRGPDRHLLALEALTAGPSVIVEYADGGTGTWQNLGSFDPAGLGVDIDSMNLTEDGLRLVLHDGNDNRAYYTDRQSFGDPFRVPAIAMDTVPTGPGLFPYMSEDCGRLYFSALDRNFVIMQ